ncbi:5-formyltetrahydrofolate cyclo-ligase [Truncatella angustata]|uniref:5-formyltetrahydrofolate cyclo-ligase n=1 Tax=Truncatella angustata TaxID=152316 RepID=A0A9P8UTH4_9PEZI|nr:5-formyltetrahydrofolate cyclo-ligase [Truncatella angustata]KAH6657886.1 5-formyltetrahydrofolate cyclo-ligase [Truncatella angustata]
MITAEAALSQAQARARIVDHKSAVRSRVWTGLLEVALADSRFHYDFGEYITDFAGSSEVTSRLASLPVYQASATLFVTPDNCLEELRRRALLGGKRVLITTYGIRRGFWLLDPAAIRDRWQGKLGGGDGWAWYASTLDGMERVGRQVSLSDLIREGVQIPVMITGTGAINTRGIRFGKGHGYFDLEWGMLYSIGVITTQTVVVSVVHDCQLLEEDLRPDVFDTVCDYVITPSRVVEVKEAQKPTCGILYDRLQPGMLKAIPPLTELKGILQQMRR